jgi:hypothetical protein
MHGALLPLQDLDQACRAASDQQDFAPAAGDVQPDRHPAPSLPADETTFGSPPSEHACPSGSSPRDPWSLASGHLCRVFSLGFPGAGAADVVIEVLADYVQGLLQFGWRLGLVGSHERAEQPVVELGVEDGELDPVPRKPALLLRGLAGA